jgi:hypothetical protein
MLDCPNDNILEHIVFVLSDAFSDVSCENIFCKPYDIVGSKNKPCENENEHYFSDTSK